MKTASEIADIFDRYLSGTYSNEAFVKAVAVEVDNTFVRTGQYILKLDACVHGDYMIDRRGDLGSTHLELQFAKGCQLTRAELDAVWGPSEKGAPESASQPWVLYYPDLRKPSFKFRGARVTAIMTAPVDSADARIRTIDVSREKP